MTFTDRQSANPGRFKMTLENGEVYYMTLERADDVIKAGTPLNAATFNAVMRELRGYADARNLLDNSNFLNPVNQRGADIYGSAATYTIDRWRAASQLEVGVYDDCIMLSCSDEATTRYGFSQYIAEEKLPAPGTMLTIAFQDDSNNLFLCTCETPESGTVYPMGSDDIGVMLNSEGRLSILVPPGVSLGLKWAAVYEGEYTAENLPAYRPKDYSAELMECMRYYQIRSTGDVAEADLRPTMRATPTITKVEGGYAYSAEP